MATAPFQPKALYDFLANMDGGLDMGRDPLLLDKNQMQLARNTTVRGSFVTHRPSFINRYSTTNYSGGVQAAFEGGLFQGGCYYRPDSGAGFEQLVLSITGRMYRCAIGGNTISIDEILDSTLTPLRNPATPPFAALWQSENYVIDQDGQSQPLIYDGAFLFRSNPGSPGTVLPGQKVAILHKDQPAVDAGGTPTGGIVAFVNYPPIGGSVIVNLTAPYTGSYGVTLDNWWLEPGTTTPLALGHFKILQYSPNGPGPIVPDANATLKNINDTVGNMTTLVAGAQVVIHTTIQTNTVIGRVTSWSAPSPGTGNIYYTITLDAVNTHNPVYIGGRAYNVALGLGTNTIRTLNPNPVSGGQVATFPSTIAGPDQVVGIISPPAGQPYTSPAVNGTVNVMLNQAYTGAALQDVFINGKNYQISPHAAQGTGSGGGTFVGNLVILQNVDQPPVNSLGQHYEFINKVVAGTPSNSAYLTTPSTTVPGTAASGVPVGTMGVYGMGRNWIALASQSGGQNYWASDLVGGPTGTKEHNYRDAVLNSKDNTYLAGGGLWTVPSAGEPITAMIFTAILDTSLGQGPMAIMTANQVFTNQAPVDRTTWQSLTTPLQTIGLKSNGAMGFYSTISANGDTIFRSIDGIRSYILARRDFETWGNVPISHEVQSLLDADDVTLLSHGSAIVFQNRLLMTATPVQHAQGVYHKAIVALNFDPQSTLRGKSPSVYDGIWDGMNVLQLFKGMFQGVERAFAVCLDSTLTKIEIHEIMPDLGTFDDDDNSPIMWSFSGHSMRFTQQGPQQRDLMRLLDGEFIVANIEEPCSFNAYWRPDQYSEWQLWRSFAVVPGTTNFRPRLGLGEPDPTLVDYQNNRPLREGFTFDFRLDCKGSCVFIGARFKVVTIPQPEFEPPSTLDSLTDPSGDVLVDPDGFPIASLI